MLVKDIKSKNVTDLNKLIDDLKAQLFMLRFQNKTGQLSDPHKISLVKKDIAKVLTILNERAKEEKNKTKASKPATATKGSK